MLLETNVIIILILVILFASTVKTTVGFGFALVSTPLLLPILDLTIIVPIIMPLVLINDYIIAIENKQYLKPDKILPIAGSAILGIPLGIIILSNLDMYVLKIIISIIILIAALFLFTGKTITIKRERLTSMFAGFFSGILVSTSGLSGPPITIFLINQKWEKLDFRNNLALYFSIIDTVTVISLIISGFITRDTLLANLFLIPSVLIGYFIGKNILPIINQQLFRQIIIVIIITGASLTLLTTLRG